MKHSYTLVDVFTSRALAGNPLAVFTNGNALPTETMQALARELNLSETTFLLRAEGDVTAGLRIFTSRRELPFAGHPVVGSAFVIARSAPLATVRFQTGVGPIDVDIERAGGFDLALRDDPARAAVPAVRRDRRPRRGARYGAARRAGAGRQRRALAARAGRRRRRRSTPTSARWRGSSRARSAASRRRRAVSCAPGCSRPRSACPKIRPTGSAAGPLAVHLVTSGLAPAGSLEIEQGVEMGRPSLIEVDVEPGRPPRVGGACVAVARGTFEL